MFDNIPFPIVVIQWDDASTDVGWEEIPKTIEPQVCVTIGFNIKETDDHVLIASTTDGHATNARIQIPKKMIIKMEVVKEKPA